MSNVSPTPSTIQSTDKDVPDRNFALAMFAILDGCKVARRAWKEAAPVYLRNGFLKIERAGVEYDLILSEIDMRAIDWYII